MNNTLNVLDNWEATKKAFRAWGITSYVVDPDLQELKVENGAIHILPEMEETVKALIMENTHEQQS